MVSVPLCAPVALGVTAGALTGSRVLPRLEVSALRIVFVVILILIAAGCGLVASIGISQVMDPNAAAKVDSEKVYVALTNIDIGTRLNTNNVKLESWPKDRIPRTGRR